MAQELEDRMLIESSKIGSRRDVDRLEDRLAEVEGVRDVEVKPDAHTVEISFDPTVISATALQHEVEALGYSIDRTSTQGAL
jgi:copper chaperone CopZ